MSITTQDIKKIAHLSRLSIQEEMIPEYVNNLNKLLVLVDEMNKVDTKNIKPMAHPLEGQSQRLRDDKITECLNPQDREHFQKIAPSTAEGLYLVPIVIE